MRSRRCAPNGPRSTAPSESRSWHGATANARIALAIAAFATVYGVIAARLVMHAAAPDVHVARRSTAQDAVATARPDLLDRNGEILATDVKAPSLFAEPRKLIDVDE